MHCMSATLSRTKAILGANIVAAVHSPESYINSWSVLYDGNLAS